MTASSSVELSMNAAQALHLLSTFYGRTVPVVRIEEGKSGDENLANTESLSRLAATAGMVVEAASSSVKKLQSGDCPLLVTPDGKNWYVVSGLRPGGLAVGLGPDKSQELLNLNELVEGSEARTWRVRPKLGSEKCQSQENFEDKGWLFSAFLPNKSAMAPVLLATLMVNFLALSIPLAIMNIFDRVISNAAFDTLWAIAIGVFLALIFDFGLRSLRAVVMDRVSAKSDVVLSNKVFGRILGARMSAHHISVGIKANSLREFDNVREYFNSMAIASLGDLPFVAFFLFFIWLVTGNLVFVPMVAVPLIFIVALSTQGRLQKLVAGNFQDTAHKNSVAIEMINGIETLKTNRAERWAAGLWERAVASQLRYSLAVRFWTAISVNLVTMMQGLTTISIMIAGVYLVTAGEITPGALFAANLLAGRCLGPIAALAMLLARIHQMKMAYAAVKDLAGMEQEREDGRNLLAPGRFTREIKFDNVSFGYQEDAPPILDNLTFSVSCGERIGIIGSIGTGKTTILKLMMALREPLTGQVLFDGIPVTHIDPLDLRAQFGAVLQGPAMFPGTIRDNILLGRMDISDEAILNALTISSAINWVRQLPLGLDTVLGENGSGLSNGQRQTLVLSRAFAANPHIIVLDEPTSDLDMKTENAFVGHIKAMPRDKTVIVVTHRPALIDAVERLLVLDNGKILLDGPKEKVMQQLKDVVVQKQKQAGVAKWQSA